MGIGEAKAFVEDESLSAVCESWELEKKKRKKRNRKLESWEKKYYFNISGSKKLVFFFSLSTQLKEAASRNSKAKIFNFIFTITVYFLYLDKIKIAI